MNSNQKPTYQELENEITALKQRLAGEKEQKTKASSLGEFEGNNVLMNDQKFRLLFENMPSAVVYAKIIYENNLPVDFEYIEVNNAFTELTGLKDVVGKKESEVLPGVQESDSGMFELLGRVATTGVSEQVEYYVNALGKWFSSKIYSPDKGYYISISDDVTAHKQIEAGEKYLNNIMSNIGDPIFVKDDQSRMLNVNDAFCEMFGLSRSQIIGSTLTEHLLPEEQEVFLNKDKQVIATGVENTNEESLTVRGKETIRISTRKTRFINSEGKVFLIGVIHDLTKRYRAENELKIATKKSEENAERFRILILNMEAGVVIHAPDSSIVHNNNRACEILGLSNDQMKGKKAIDPDWKFITPDQSPLPLAEYPVNRIAASKKAIKNQLVGLYQPNNNQLVWASVNGFPVLNASGEITEIVTIFIDITEQKQNEEDSLNARLRLEEIQKELSNAQKLAQVGSWLFYPSTEKSEWSDEMFVIWGFELKELAPELEPIVKRIHPDDLELFKRTLNQAISQGLPYDIELRICLPDKQTKVIRSICKPIIGEKGEVISLTGSTQDITYHKLFEEEQVKHQRLRAIGEMSSSIAHDFNNSLQEMMGNLEIIKFQKDLSDSTLERLESISSIITDAAGRVSALQKFGDTENEDKNATLIDLNKLIEDSLKQSRPLWKDAMEKKGLIVDIITDTQDLPKISCNRGELKSAVYNLIKNSIEAMPNGGELSIITRLKNNKVIATFADTGSGMDEEAKLKVFEPFFTTKGFQLGRGLGMSGVYSIVKKHKGDIRIKSSELGKGTTIEMEFPASSQEEAKAVTKAAPKELKPLSVLWVDDDFIITKSSRMLVESIGHTCKSVNSGKKALEHLDNNTYDIVFTDIGMPKMNGWELADAIRSKFGHQIKIAAVTGWNVEEHLKAQHDIDFVLQKPFSLAELKDILMLV